MLFSLTAEYTPQALNAMRENPNTDRRAAVEQVLAAADGKLIAMYGRASNGPGVLVIFGVADCPVRATEAEEALVGRRLGDEAVADEVSRVAPSGIDFASDVHVSATYRREASTVLVRRAVMDAIETMERR